ncbi:MAG: hypothetical protein FE834_03980 [Gammaproteobacteria bacterium]|nr:hypothetical protein [Gammaproteobacteria bacterium]
MSENEINKNTTERGFFGKLSNGDFGLAKTYWIYNVLVNVVANILVELIVSIELFVFVLVAMIAYSIPALIGLWKSASKYKGSKIWSVLAKIVTILGIIFSIGLLSPLISLFKIL